MAAQGLTIGQVAAAIGRHDRHLFRLARGQGGASRGTALELLLQLDVQPSTLLVVPSPTLAESRWVQAPAAPAE
jgi:plasmid maintenance system antidote protein VapI